VSGVPSYDAGRVNSRKRSVTVWRPSVSLSRRHTHRDSPGAACDAASVNFGPTVESTVILVVTVVAVAYCILFLPCDAYVQTVHMLCT